MHVTALESHYPRTAFAYFQGRSHPMDVRLGSHIRVSQARIHEGLRALRDGSTLNLDGLDVLVDFISIRAASGLRAVG